VSGPLERLTVLLTRDEGMAADIEALGAEVRVVKLNDYEPLRAEIDPAGYDWIAFTSRRAVEFADLPLADLPRDGGPKIACVGPATAAAVVERGGAVDLVPEKYSAADLAAAMISGGLSAGERVLFPASEMALPTLPEALVAAGVEVTRVAVYRPTPPRGGAELDAAEGVDVVVVLSPMAVEVWFALGGRTDLDFLAIGPTTAAKLVDFGVAPLVAPSADRRGIIAALTGLKEKR
jgi:uroporphyrinogen III methyltransferase/synthase